MEWINFSNYKMKEFDFTHDGTKIHMCIRVRRSNNKQFRKILVTWTTPRFRGVKFNFEVPRPHPNRTPWGVVFNKLRISLAYGLNQKSRAVTDRLMGITDKYDSDGSIHPIHNMVRTSRNI